MVGSGTSYPSKTYCCILSKLIFAKENYLRAVTVNRVYFSLYQIEFTIKQGQK